MAFDSCFTLTIASSTKTHDHFHQLDAKNHNEAHSAIAIAYRLAALCPAGNEPVILSNGAVYKVSFVRKNQEQSSHESNESDQITEKLTETIRSSSGVIRARAASTQPYELAAVVPNAKVAEFLRAFANASSDDAVILESHCSGGRTRIDPLDPALLPGKQRRNQGFLSGPFPIRAIGRNWKDNSVEIHLSNGIVITLPEAPGFKTDDVRPAFDARYALVGTIRENRDSGAWEIEEGAKLVPIQGTRDLFERHTP